MHNVVKLIQKSGREAPPVSASRVERATAHTRSDPQSFNDITFRHGFEAFAVLSIDQRKGGVIDPMMGLNSLGAEVLARVAQAGELSRCSVFLMLADTNSPFSFATGLDCRTNKPPDPSLSDNALDAVLNDYGLHGGYCVPVFSPKAQRSVVMYFGRRFERFDVRYPELVLETIECFEHHWYQTATAETIQLSPLEVSCMQKLGDGKSVGEMGAELGFSDHAVNVLIRAVVEKLGASTVADAVLKASRMGLI